MFETFPSHDFTMRLKWTFSMFSFVLQMKSMDANRYATKKTIAQGMLDIALLTANASQLKYILQVGQKHEFYTLMLILISVSIIMQVNIIIILLLLVLIGHSVFVVWNHLIFFSINWRLNVWTIWNFTIDSILFMEIDYRVSIACNWWVGFKSL